MTEVTNEEATEKANAAVPAAAADRAVDSAAPTHRVRRVKARNVIGTFRRHPIGVILAIGAAAALVEFELAVGMLAGIGAAALLMTKTGPEARQEVAAKGKAAIARARLALASRSKPRPSETTAPVTPAPEQPQTPGVGG